MASLESIPGGPLRWKIRGGDHGRKTGTEA
jgi:hypothetical protein